MIRHVSSASRTPCERQAATRELMSSYASPARSIMKDILVQAETRIAYASRIMRHGSLPLLAVLSACGGHSVTTASNEEASWNGTTPVPDFDAATDRNQFEAEANMDLPVDMNQVDDPRGK